jgi:hypothetical protein
MRLSRAGEVPQAIQPTLVRRRPESGNVGGELGDLRQLRLSDLSRGENLAMWGEKYGDSRFSRGENDGTLLVRLK